MRTLTIIIASLAAVAALAVSGCGDSGKATASKEDAATLPNRVTVTMGEWFFRADQPRVKAGKVTVTGKNVGDIEHELIALRTDLPADRMPMAHDGAELDLEKAGEIMIGEMHEHMDEESAEEHMDGETADDHMDEVDDHMDGAGEGAGETVEAEADEHAAEEGHLEAGEMRSYTVSLKPGKYVLLCSIPGHYQSGQYLGLVAVSP